MPYIHRIRPEIIQFTETLAIRWYGLSYLVGFLVGYWILVRFAKQGRLPIPAGRVQDFLTALAFFGVMLGGRLGYFLFYQPGTLLRDPLSFFQVWKGGMASHGGLLGCGLVVLWWARRQQVSFWDIMDPLVVAGTPGLAFGRIANFINGELWGRPTSVPWAVVFPEEIAEFAADGRLATHRYDLPILEQFVEMGYLLPRHPSQLYQAFLEGALLFAILWCLSRRSWCWQKPGRLSLVFLLGYGTARFAMEFFREPDQGAPIFMKWMTTGQLLTLAMFVLAAALIAFPQRFGRVKPPAKTP